MNRWWLNIKYKLYDNVYLFVIKKESSILQSLSLLCQWPKLHSLHTVKICNLLVWKILLITDAVTKISSVGWIWIWILVAKCHSLRFLNALVGGRWCHLGTHVDNIIWTNHHSLVAELRSRPVFSHLLVCNSSILWVSKTIRLYFHLIILILLLVVRVWIITRGSLSTASVSTVLTRACRPLNSRIRVKLFLFLLNLSATSIHVKSDNIPSRVILDHLCCFKCIRLL